MEPLTREQGDAEGTHREFPRQGLYRWQIVAMLDEEIIRRHRGNGLLITVERAFRQFHSRFVGRAL